MTKVTKVTVKIKTHVRARDNLILLIGIFCRYLKNLYLCIGYLENEKCHTQKRNCHAWA